MIALGPLLSQGRGVIVRHRARTPVGGLFILCSPDENHPRRRHRRRRRRLERLRRHSLRPRHLSAAGRLWPEAAVALGSLAWGLWAELSGASWAAWPRATCWPDDCFCEALRSAGVAQPANAWSNAGFLLAGLWVSRDALARGFPAGRILGLSTTLIGAASLFFHATFTFAGMWLDLAGMYLFVTFLALSALGLGPRLAHALAGLNAGLGVLTWLVPGARRWVFAALAAAAAAAQMRARPADRRFLWAALGLLGAGFALWSADYRGVACAPDSLVQGHAAWHLFGAAAAGAVYLHLRGASSGALRGELSQQHEP